MSDACRRHTATRSRPYEAAGPEQERRKRAEDTEIQHDRACRGEYRRGISSWGTEGDRPLETDERAGKPADHQRPVRNQLVLPR